jgi:prevent-host-death family protein
MSEDREIPQRELRNDVAGVLRKVAAGERIRVTVRGRPVAELVPISGTRRFVPRSEVEALIADVPLDAGFAGDVRAVLSATTDEL